MMRSPSTGYGIMTDGCTTFINSSTCTVSFQPTNPPIVFDLPNPSSSWEWPVKGGGVGQNNLFFLTNNVKIIILSVSLKYCYFVSCKVKECGGGVGLEGGQVIGCWVVIQSYYGRKSSRICKINDALWICTISFVFGVCVCWKRRYWMPLLILYVIVFCVWFHFVSWTILLSDWLTGTMP